MPASFFLPAPETFLLSTMYLDQDCPPRIDCGAHYFRTLIRQRTGAIGFLQIGFPA
jgi:hypothetical protein